MGKKKIEPQHIRHALEAVQAWVKDPDGVDKPDRAALAQAVRLSVRALAEDAPGNSVEVRVPPFVAVQCIQGPSHTRGTPPNVVEMSPLTWLRVAMGIELFDDNPRISTSGIRAREVSHWLPVVDFSRN
ncbi:hypothetical protein EML15_05560 [Corynebacterium sp. sy017]|uniref:sterol carrier family protein n=1 Tax=unclassified Corynebacterium TaxID=2624378 RepID=UPI0011866338|nr:MULTISPECIES: sterol carrier family protein [unclassified Corynebacterium]MBP3088613.1 hypothetical protein [Corynebacterium sp. sy017]TSD91905.1 hypothetical protein ELY17_05560 [Corynebacterium sp. SY003]